ncbi:MAG: GNAT family N-acetyltransferase, partial [Alphaproteobacteria bacterium]|nr:GNAT family N-acetyltransferase [Alphaproteobacteria bacterium]
MSSRLADHRVTIAVAAHEADVQALRELFLEYEAWLDAPICFAGFQAELKDLPGVYGPPSGCLPLARVDHAAAGCVAVKPLSDRRCEIKRLYVRPDFRGHRLGRRL